MKTKRHHSKLATEPSGKRKGHSSEPRVTAADEMSPWPTRDSGVVPGDGRTWADIDDWLKSHGTSLQERVEAMKGQSRGGPGSTQE